MILHQIQTNSHTISILNTQEFEVYYETRNGFWVKLDYDSNGDRIYYENSMGVVINGAEDDR